jgi:LysM repeat protein
MTMNNQSPLVPQGSLLEQKNKGRARVKIAVFLVLAIHGVGLMALLMQGCKKEPDTTTGGTNAAAYTEPTNAPAPSFIEPTNSPSLAATNGLPGTVAAPIPEQPQTPPNPPPATASDYTIAKGDTFSTIAKKFHVPTKALLEANPSVEPTKLKIGQTIHIPAVLAAALMTTGITAAPLTDTGSTGKTYSVKSGDSLTKIAGEFGVTVKALRSENHLKTDKIVVGQKLTIPGKTSITTTSTAPASTAPTSTSSGQ